MSITKICLHSPPDCEAGQMKIVGVAPYDGQPKRDVEFVFELRGSGARVSTRVVARFRYTYTDALGIPHYERISL